MIDDAKDADTDSYHQQTQPRKTVQRRTAPRTTAAPAPDPRYVSIDRALKECTDIDQPIAQTEVEANPEIKSLFSERKRALHVITF